MTIEPPEANERAKRRARPGRRDLTLLLLAGCAIAVALLIITASFIKL